MLDEYNFLRQEKDEEKRRLRDQKKIQEQLITEQETLFGSKPSPIKANLSSKKANGGSRPSVGGTGSQPNRRLSLGNALMQPATPELLRTNGVTTPSRLGASVGKDTKRERARPVAPLNYVALNKDDNAGLNSAGGKSTAAVRGQQAVQPLALRQPLSPVVLATTPLQAYMDDSVNRLPSAQLAQQASKAAAYSTKNSMSGTSLTDPDMHDLENSTPREVVEYSFEERRVSLLG
jgi:hypothetical protein